jgi:hypothetical protein
MTKTRSARSRKMCPNVLDFFQQDNYEEPEDYFPTKPRNKTDRCPDYTARRVQEVFPSLNFTIDTFTLNELY